MKPSSMTSLRAKYALAIFLSITTVYALPRAADAAGQATAKKPLSMEDYTKWRSITGQEISGDGKWVTYVLQLTNVPTPKTKPVLHLLNLETNEDVSVADATGGVFSPDSKWIAYQVDARAPRGRGRGAALARRRTGDAGRDPATPPATPPVTPPDCRRQRRRRAPGAQPPAQPGGRGAAAATTPPRRVELRNLATGDVQSWQDIGTFTFSPTSTHIFLKRRRRR